MRRRESRRGGCDRWKAEVGHERLEISCSVPSEDFGLPLRLVFPSWRRRNEREAVVERGVAITRLRKRRGVIGPLVELQTAPVYGCRATAVLRIVLQTDLFIDSDVIITLKSVSNAANLSISPEENLHHVTSGPGILTATFPRAPTILKLHHFIVSVAPLTQSFHQLHPQHAPTLCARCPERFQINHCQQARRCTVCPSQRLHSPAPIRSCNFDICIKMLRIGGRNVKG